jgi:hypothetical protein
VNIAVFPSLILLSFPGVSDDDGFHLLRVENELDVDKLGRADLLANHVGKEEAPLLLAYWRLKAIATAPPKFGQWYWSLSGYALSGFMVWLKIYLFSDCSTITLLGASGYEAQSMIRLAWSVMAWDLTTCAFAGAAFVR